MKDRGRWLVAILCLFLLLLLGVAARADAPKSFDVIMILDCSGSMKKNDPKQMMLNGAALFMDICDVSGSRAAVVPFSSNITNEVGLTTLDTPDARNKVRNAIVNNRYYGYTDTGIGFQRAWEAYKKASRNGNETIVIYFSDGDTRIDPNEVLNPGATNRSIELSQEMLNNFTGAGVPVYAIGLLNGDFQGSFARTVARESGTNGGKPYLSSQNPEDLPRFFKEIFAEYIDTIPQEIGTYETDGTLLSQPIYIPNNSIIEANITLKSRHGFGLSDIKVVNPDGVEIQGGDFARGTDRLGPGAVLIGSTDSYVNIKIVRPDYGEWVVWFRGQPSDVINIELVANVDIDLKLTDNQGGKYKKNDVLNVTGRFFQPSDGQPYEDTGLYGDKTLVLALGMRDKESIENIEVKVGADRLSYEIPFQLDRSGDYSFWLKAKVFPIQHSVNGVQTDMTDLSQAQFAIERTSTPAIVFHVDNHAPVRSALEQSQMRIGIEPLSGPAVEVTEVDLSLYFTDADNDRLRYTLAQEASNERKVDYAFDGDSFKIFSPEWKGVIRFTITANDGEVDADKPLLFSVTVYSIKGDFYRFITTVSVGALIALGIALAVYLITKPKFKEKSSLSMDFVNIHDFTRPPLRKIPMERYGTSKVDLHSVLSDAGSASSSLITSISDELRAIEIKPAYRERVWVKNRGKSADFSIRLSDNKSFRRVRVDKGVQVRLVAENGVGGEDGCEIRMTYY